jgi:hypothetical protein
MNCNLPGLTDCLNQRWAGRAVVRVTDDDPRSLLAATLIQHHCRSTPHQMQSSPGIPDGWATNDIVMPLLMSNNSGYWTGFALLNNKPTAQSVTLGYGPNTNTSAGRCNVPAPRTISLSGDGFAFVLQPNDFTSPSSSCTYVGSGQVLVPVDSYPLPLAVQVNQISNNTAGAATYVPINDPMPGIVFPDIVNQTTGDRWWSGFQIMNELGEWAAFSVELGPNTSTASNRCASSTVDWTNQNQLGTKTLAPMASMTILTDTLGIKDCDYRGSVYVTGRPGMALSGSANVVSRTVTSADFFRSYAALPR